FGCVAYSHVQQGKLKPRAVKCVLLGYPEGVKGHVELSIEELQVEVELQRLNNHTLEEDQTDNEDQTNQDDGDDEDAGDQEIDQPLDLTDYQLVRDKEPMTRTKPLSSKWKAAMKEEMDSLRKNKTWELVDHQAGQKLVTCKWLFKIKEGIEGVQKHRYKARLVARGFTQRADDMMIACKSKAEIGSTKSLLKRKFDMKDLGVAKKILGMEIVRDRRRKILRVSQSGYVSKFLNNFRIDNGKSVQMPL
nr:retrovirus-related Pol polyprotein from transposon TNT 1-94 [Tanacetum cinerariifolium]